jgi:hypothetical protein
MRLVLPILLIACGALLAAMQIPALISRASRQRRSAAQRRTSWTWFHAGVIDIGAGLLQCFHQPRWDMDPWLLMYSCYLGFAGVWLILPYIRRTRSR